MGFLDKLGLDVIATEKEMLRALRGASEQWYNELTKPFFFVLNGDLHSSDLKASDREQLSKLADKMLLEEVVVNHGDEVANVLAEIKLSSGIPFFSDREELRERILRFLRSGDFLKKFVYGDFKSHNTKEIQRGISEAQEQWLAFRENKDALVDRINEQLAKIG